MNCKHPFIKDASGKILHPAVKGSVDSFYAIPFPCGQCLPCRINRRRIWTSRIMLESFLHDSSIFVTLTYSPEFLEDCGLNKRTIQLWLKSFRKALNPRKVRYYIVGEYGDKTFRPHYHAILFGCSLLDSDLIKSTWHRGLIHVGDVTEKSAQYVAGYVVKKMTKSDDDRLGGLNPEFALMSRKPGIGGYVADLLADKLSAFDAQPTTVTIGQKSFPLGRYLLDRIYSSGLVDESVRQQRLEQYLTVLKAFFLKNGVYNYESAIIAEAASSVNRLSEKHRFYRRSRPLD